MMELVETWNFSSHLWYGGGRFGQFWELFLFLILDLSSSCALPLPTHSSPNAIFILPIHAAMPSLSLHLPWISTSLIQIHYFFCGHNCPIAAHSMHALKATSMCLVNAFTSGPYCICINEMINLTLLVDRIYTIQSIRLVLSPFLLSSVFHFKSVWLSVVYPCRPRHPFHSPLASVPCINRSWRCSLKSQTAISSHWRVSQPFRTRMRLIRGASFTKSPSSLRPSKWRISALSLEACVLQLSIWSLLRPPTGWKLLRGCFLEKFKS